METCGTHLWEKKDDGGAPDAELVSYGCSRTMGKFETFPSLNKRIDLCSRLLKHFLDCFKRPRGYLYEKNRFLLCLCVRQSVIFVSIVRVGFAICNGNFSFTFVPSFDCVTSAEMADAEPSFDHVRSPVDVGKSTWKRFWRKARPKTANTITL